MFKGKEARKQLRQHHRQQRAGACPLNDVGPFRNMRLRDLVLPKSQSNKRLRSLFTALKGAELSTQTFDKGIRKILSEQGVKLIPLDGDQAGRAIPRWVRWRAKTIIRDQPLEKGNDVARPCTQEFYVVVDKKSEKRLGYIFTSYQGERKVWDYQGDEKLFASQYDYASHFHTTLTGKGIGASLLFEPSRKNRPLWDVLIKPPKREAK